MRPPEDEAEVAPERDESEHDPARLAAMVDATFGD